MSKCQNHCHKVSQKIISKCNKEGQEYDKERQISLQTVTGKQ